LLLGNKSYEWVKEMKAARGRKKKPKGYGAKKDREERCEMEKKKLEKARANRL